MSSQMGLSTLVGAGGRYLATILKYKYQKLKYQKRAFTSPLIGDGERQITTGLLW